MLIQSAIQHNGTALVDSMPRTRDDAMQVLAAEGQEIISVDAGPVQVGTAAHAFTPVHVTVLLGFVKLSPTP